MQILIMYIFYKIVNKFNMIVVHDCLEEKFCIKKFKFCDVVKILITFTKLEIHS